MDLHSGIPFWLARNGLLADLPSLETDLLDEDIVIIGSGISGALVAHELCTRGAHCTMLDSRMLSSGSTWDSTAQLNYEIDTPFEDLKKWYGAATAAAVYRANLEAVGRIEEILKETNTEASYIPRSSLYLASDRKGIKMLKKEFSFRKEYDIPAQLLEKEALKSEWDLDYPLAIMHHHAAEVDSYRAAAGIIRFHSLQGNLKVYTRTKVVKMKSEKGGVVLETEKENRIQAKKVIVAAGYESQVFLPKKIARLESTYALVSQVLPEDLFWKGKALIWETARPYFYLRATPENRIMMGGEDIPFKNAKLRDALLEKKTEKLLEKCGEIFPALPRLHAEFYWCGTFAEAEDGLPFAGMYPGLDHVYFALGYGGNGTTFSCSSAAIIANTIFGEADLRKALFAFDRKKG